jgi:cell wall-associated NlpC family hydrolase
VTWRRLRRKARRWVRRHPLAAFGVVVVLAALVVHTGQTAAASAGTRAPTRTPPALSQVIAYARAQIGKPYAWGGTGPDAYDCSGLVMMAYRQIGITFNSSRPTADTEWQYGPQVTPASLVPGDLVFFPGSDGTDADPGHVGIVVDPAAHLMIDAYATGYPITEETYGLPSSRDGLTAVVGFTAPGGGS